MSMQWAGLNWWRRVGLTLAGLALAGLGGCNRAKSTALDQSTPQAAVHSAIRAISEQNSQQVRQCFLAQTSAQQAYVQAMGRLMEAAAAMAEKLRARFGREAARDVIGSGGPSEEDFNRFVEGSQQINGSQAQLTDSLGHVLVLRSVEGAWKIVPEGSGSGEPLQRQTDVLNAMAGVLTDVAADVNRFPEAQDIKGEILRREEAVLNSKDK